MYCNRCGKPIDPSAAFCPSCGAANVVNHAPFTPTGTPPQGRLYRSRTDRMVGGVCAGLARAYGWDLTIVRLILVLTVLFAGTGVLAYLIAWVVIPEEPFVYTPIVPNP